ncbi:MAG: transcriptional repressor LexA [bacterium]|nr:transcriptional repressor LexA [bacterium]
MRSKKLTDKQQLIFDFITGFSKQMGYPPSIGDISQKFGIKSPKGVVDHLTAIERKGYIKRKPNISRGITIVSKPSVGVLDAVKNVAIIGTIAAGSPLLAEQNITGHLPVPQNVAAGADCFALRVKGDSMIDAGIYDGDYVIARVQNIANNGDIVIALIENEATVKYFYTEDGQIRLQPANNTLGPLYVSPEEIQIQGKVIAVYRFLN